MPPAPIEPSPTPHEPSASGLGSWLRRVGPFVVALLLVAFVLSRLDLAAFTRSLREADALSLFGLALGFLLALLSADTFATVVTFRRSVLDVGFGAFWVLRAASYVPSLLNHHVGQAFLALAVSRRYNVPLARVAGATLLVYASWIACILGLTGLALALRGLSLALPILFAIGALAYLVIIELRPAALSRRAVLAPLFEAGALGHLIAVAARLPHLVVLFLGTWLPFEVFGVHIPLRDALGTIPVMMVAVTLPITPQGFGTRDVLAALFFERFAPGATHEARLATLAAATTSWGVALTLLEAALGSVLLYGVLHRRDSSQS